MKLLRCSFNNDNLDAYFDPATRIVYAVRTWRKDVFDVCAFDSSRESDDQWAFASLSVDFTTEAEAMTELDRIAALIEGKAPAQGWVSGAPPQDGKTYVVAYDHDEMRPGVARWVDGEFEDDSGQHYGDIRYHLPTPIQLPKES